MTRLDEINKMLEELSVSADNARAEKAAAEEKARCAEEKVKKAENAKVAFEDVRKKGEAFEESYNTAMKNTGYTNSNNNAEKNKNNTNKKFYQKRGFKTFVSITTIAAMLAGGYVLGNVFPYNKKNNGKDKVSDDEQNDTKQIYYLDKESGKYLPYEQEFYVKNEETGEYEPYVTEFYYFNEETGEYEIYEEEKKIISQEEYNKLIDTLQTTLVSKENDFDGLFKVISDDSELLESFINALNFYSIIDNQELVSELKTNGDLGEDAGRYVLINNGDRVRDNILSYNINQWLETKSTENFIDISDFIYDETQCALVADMEASLDEIVKLVNDGNEELANQKVDELFDSLERGELYNVDNATGYFVVRYIASIISDIIMNSGMNMTGVTISEDNRARAEILKGSVCDDFDQTKDGGLGNLYYRNLMASIEGLNETLENEDTLFNVETSGLKRTRGLI